MPLSIPYPVLQAVAAGSGFLTWCALSRRSIRGDFAAVMYACACAAMYTALGFFTTSHEHALTIAVCVAATYASSALISTAVYRLSPWHPLAQYPGPLLCRVSSLWLTAISLRGRRHHVLHRLHLRYGTFVRIGPNILSINSPFAHQIYSGAERMAKSDSYRAPGHEHIVCLFFKQHSEKLHSERKRVWSGLFTKEGLSQLTPFLEKRAFQFIDFLERRQAQSSDNTVDLADCFFHLAYDFMGDFIFGGCAQLDMMKNGDRQGMIKTGKLAMLFLDSFGQTPWLLDLIWRLPYSPLLRLKGHASRLMNRRLQVTEPPSFRDLVSFLTEDGTIPTEHLQMEAIVAILGGADNTSIVLTLTIYYLTREEKYMHLLGKQLHDAFPDPCGPLPDDMLSQIPLLDAVITETLRLSSPYFLPRIVPKGGFRIEDHVIPEGTIVAQAAYSQQIDVANFSPNPTDFLPERWLPNSAEHNMKVNRSVLSSFSAGPYVCIAKQLAYQEMRHILARLVLSMDIRPAEGFDPEAFRNGILNMRTTYLERPFPVRVQRRGDKVPLDDDN